MATKTQRVAYRRVGKRSMCRGLRVNAPNKCKKVKSCKVAARSSTKRATYCRKKKATRYSKRTRRM